MTHYGRQVSNDEIARVGDELPDATLLSVEGSKLRLSQAICEGLAVLVLYRGAWCPFCSVALRAYQAELLPALRDRGVRLVAISSQRPDGSLSMREKHQLEFAVLSDRGNQVARALGVLTEPSAETREAQRELGLDLGAVNADGTAGIPMPTTAIVDDSLIVHWIDVHREYTTRSEPEEILAALGLIAVGRS